LHVQTFPHCGGGCVDVPAGRHCAGADRAEYRDGAHHGSTGDRAPGSGSACRNNDARCPCCRSNWNDDDRTRKPKKKKPAKQLTRQQEIDRSIDRGTVPARYRSQVPKEYQHYIPFDKR
jgi:hypothetical protein